MARRQFGELVGIMPLQVRVLSPPSSFAKAIRRYYVAME